MSTYGYNEQIHIDSIDVEEKEIIPVPTNLIATPGDSQVTLNWDAVTDATGYNVKRSITAGDPYDIIASNVSGTYVDSDVINGTAYYYVITAITADGESGNSNEASSHPTGRTGGRREGLLKVTMIDSSEREYKLPMSEIQGFTSWLNSHSSSDTLSYQLGTAFGSKEYLLFDKIISFEVTTLPAE